MSAAAPWSVKGIDPKAREVAKDLARRSGMTLGEWLNTMIMDDDEDAVAPLPRRPHVTDIFERRGRSRRLDDAYEQETHGLGLYQRDRQETDETLRRVAASVEAIADRLEASEQRSTVAIQGVDQAVSGLVRRLDERDQQSKVASRRIDDIAEELREGHRRLRNFEQQVGPQTVETFGKMETSVGALAARLYDIEERQRGGVNELRQRMDVLEKAAGPGVGSDLLAQVGGRLDEAQARTSDALRGLERSFADLDQRLKSAEGRVEPEGLREAARFEKLAETLSRQVETNRTEMMRRLDTAEAEGRMDRIERAVQQIGEQARLAEHQSAQGIEAMGREVLRIAQNLNGRVAEVEGIGKSLVNDVTETVSRNLKDKLDRSLARHNEAVEHRLTQSQDQNALALERLGGEITRISDRLSDRIAQSERKSAQAIEDIARRLSENTERVEQRQERDVGELSERMRLSEERTARLLSEARETLEQRSVRPVFETPLMDPVSPVSARVASASYAPHHEAAPLSVEPMISDWRASVFPGEMFEGGDAAGRGVWADDPLLNDENPAPFPDMFAPRERAEEAFEPTRDEGAIVQPFADTVLDDTVLDDTPMAATTVSAPVSTTPFGTPSPSAFGGADIGDVLEAIDNETTKVVPTATFDAAATPDDFGAETDFVDPATIRAGLRNGSGQGRSVSTQGAINAARAAMAATPDEGDSRKGFGLNLKRGGKSRLQERLDKQAGRDGSTMRKAMLASVTGMAVVSGIYVTGRLANVEAFDIPGLEQLDQALGLSSAPIPTVVTPTPLAAVALTPTGVTPIAAKPVSSEGQALFERAIEQLDAGQADGVKTLIQSANLGHVPAQLKLAGLYETGSNGVGRDLAESRSWARRAAEGKDPQGMHAYGMYLFDGIGGGQNRTEALQWLLKAANAGLTDSQYNVARIYERGDEGIAPNPTEAFKWYLIASRTGDAQAKAAVDRLTPTTPDTGRRIARAAADAFAANDRG